MLVMNLLPLQQYIDVTPAMLRPWVERWAGVVLGAGADGVRLGA